MVVKEMAVYYKKRQVGKGPEGVQVMTSADVARVFAFLKEKAHEECWVACLAADNTISAIYQVSKGAVTSADVDPREVFKAALLANASSVILVHNHPTGNPSPSGADREVTKRIKEAGKLLSIPLIDHIVVSDHRHASFVEMGIL